MVSPAVQQRSVGQMTQLRIYFHFDPVASVGCNAALSFLPSGVAGGQTGGVPLAGNDNFIDIFH